MQIAPGRGTQIGRGFSKARGEEGARNMGRSLIIRGSRAYPCIPRMGISGFVDWAWLGVIGVE